MYENKQKHIFERLYVSCESKTNKKYELKKCL